LLVARFYPGLLASFLAPLFALFDFAFCKFWLHFFFLASIWRLLVVAVAVFLGFLLGSVRLALFSYVLFFLVAFFVPFRRVLVFAPCLQLRRRPSAKVFVAAGLRLKV